MLQIRLTRTASVQNILALSPFTEIHMRVYRSSRRIHGAECRRPTGARTVHCETPSGCEQATTSLPATSYVDGLVFPYRPEGGLMRTGRTWLLSAAALLAAATFASAQTTTGTISGHVVDTQGLALP